MTKGKIGDPVRRNHRRRVTREQLHRHAHVLTGVLFALREVQPKLTSDALWGLISINWDEDVLEKEIGRVRKSLQAFKDLVVRHQRATRRANRKGYFEADGEQWMNKQGLSRIPGISRTTLLKRLRADPKDIRIRYEVDHIGHVRPFYAVKDIEALFADRLGSDPEVISSDEYCSMDELTKRFRLGKCTVMERIRQCNVPSVRSKGEKGYHATCYSFERAREACKDLLDRPMVDAHGALVKDDVLWVSRTALIRRTTLRRTQVSLLLTVGKGVRRLDARDYIGKGISVYAITDVQRVCRRQYGFDIVLNDAEPGDGGEEKVAGLDGTFVFNEKRWIGTSKYAQKHQLSEKTVIRKIKQARLRSLTGKTRLRIPRPFFSEVDLDRACADLLKKKSEESGASAH